MLSKSSNPGNVLAGCSTGLACGMLSKSSNPGNVLAGCSTDLACGMLSKSSNPGNVLADCSIVLAELWLGRLLISFSSSSEYIFLSFLIFILSGIITFPVILCSLRLLSNKSIPLGI